MRAGDDRSDRVAGHLAAVDTAARLLGPLAQRDVPLGPLTTYRVGGCADLFVSARERDDVVRVAQAAQATGLDVLPIGRGSNMLVADRGYRGLALHLVDLADDVDIDTRSHVVTASAGTALPVLARKTAAAGLHGFEWAVGVPGSVGGAVRMNAGGHGSDMEASLIDVVIVDLAADTAQSAERVVGVADLGLGFRHSELSPSAVVMTARLQLSAGDRARSEQLIAEIVSWRRAHQPGGQNAGSVFVNPVPGEVSAGALIDGAGLRGYRIGTAQVSDKHANFIQADDGGSADDVRAVMRVVRDRVEAATGYALRSEVRLVGFDDGDR